jgi:hypothetical protein
MALMWRSLMQTRNLNACLVVRRGQDSIVSIVAKLSAWQLRNYTSITDGARYRSLLQVVQTALGPNQPLFIVYEELFPPW